MGARSGFVRIGNERGVSLVDLAVSQRLGRGPIPEYGPGEQARQDLRALSKGGILDAVRPALPADSDIRSAK